MATTLQERVNERMTALGLTNAQVAAACNVSPPTAFHWSSGKTKKMKAEPLLLAAALFRVTVEWLASGKGPKFQLENKSDAQPAIEQPIPTYIGTKPLDKWSLDAVKILSKLDDAGKAAALARLKEFVNYLDPPSDGQALPMASKTERKA
ncbi:MAG TPA: hypothetical protein VIK56_15650 [Rhodoferax sp.]